VRSPNLSQRLARTNLYVPLGFGRAASRAIASADLVHVHDFFAWTSYRATERASAAGRPVVLSPHGSLSTARERGRSRVKRAWMRLLGERTIARARVLHVFTEAEAAVCRELGVPGDKLRVIQNGVAGPPRRGDGEGFRARFGLGARPVILFVGRLLAGKGVDLLVEVARRLADRSDAADAPRFVLVGPPENRPDLGAGWRGTNLLFTGLLEGRDLDDAYAAASLFVLPSFSEGMPMTALDALAFGLPCVLSSACNLPEVARAGAGLEIEPTVASLEAGLRAALAERARWPSMREAALALARGRFDIERVRDGLEGLYQELVDAA
jgi:poly(glycerol-phosphate) alpha-glucosyltransferase